jgi:hypothetical protein
MGYRLPLVLQTHASLSGGLKFLGLGPEEHKVAELMPGAGVMTAYPGKGVAGIAEPTRVAVYDTYLNTGLHLSTEDGHRIVASLHEAWEDLRSDYAVLTEVERSSLTPPEPPLPYHDGAIEYFQGAGLWSAAHQANQDRLLAL